MKRKQLSKMVALASALALSLSVGMVAFAAPGESPTKEDMVEVSGTNLPEGSHLEAKEGKDNIDQSTKAGKDAYEVLSKSPEEVEKEIKDILNKNPNCKYVAGSIKVLTVQEIKLVDGSNQPVAIPAGSSIDVKIKAAGAKVGDVVYVIHWTGNGYEVLEGKVVDGGGYVTVTLTSLSPVAVIKVMDEKGGTPKLKVVDTTAKSPKTGK